MSAPLTLAVAKGRLLKQSLPLLEAAGVRPIDDIDRSRKLVFETSDPDVHLMVIRATDVPAFVQHGAADLGITGKDVLLEHEGGGLYEPLDLRIGRCRLMVAGKPDVLPAGHRIRIATKYVNTARRYFAARGMQVEIIKLYGSMELAPLCGLADRIVDLVETGSTLRANGLEALEHVADVSARLVVNPASLKMKHERVGAFVNRLTRAVNARAEAA